MNKKDWELALLTGHQKWKEEEVRQQKEEAELKLIQNEIAAKDCAHMIKSIHDQIQSARTYHCFTALIHLEKCVQWKEAKRNLNQLGVATTSTHEHVDTSKWNAKTKHLVLERRLQDDF
jgi:hypothetical protein